MPAPPKPRWSPPRSVIEQISACTIDNLELTWTIIERIRVLAHSGENPLDIVRRLNPTTSNRCPVCDRPGRGTRDGHR